MLAYFLFFRVDFARCRVGRDCDSRLFSLRPRLPARAYWIAVAGCIAFAAQTLALDAVIWPAFFPV